MNTKSFSYRLENTYWQIEHLTGFHQWHVFAALCNTRAVQMYR